MLIHALGAVAVAGARGLVELRGSRQVGLLALLTVQVGRTVHAALIEHELWRGAEISDAAVRVTANRLRAQLRKVTDRECIVTSADGYRLDLAESEIDAERYLSLVGEGRRLAESGAGEAALRRYTEAEELWRGHPFAGCDHLPSVRPFQERLLIARRDAGADRAGLLMATGDQRAALDALRELTTADPYDERLWALRVGANYLAGRQREALHCYQEVRRILDDELGLAPGAQLREVETAVLDQIEPDSLLRLLGLSAPHPGWTEADTLVPSSLVTSPPFVGRRSDLDLLAGHLLAADRERVTAVVEAAAGLGKTRLATELEARADRQGVRCVWLRSRRGQPALSVVLDLVAAVADVDHPSLGSAGAAADRDPDARRLRLRISAARVLRQSATQGQSPIVVLDDLQWIDEESAAVLRYVHDAVPAGRWLVLTRTGERSEAARELLATLRSDTHLDISLGPLPDDAMRSLIEHLGAGDQADTIIGEAIGSPLLAIELARSGIGGGQPAASLAALCSAELDRLTSIERRIVLCLAASNHPCPLSVLLETEPGLRPDDLAAILQSTVAAGLVTVEESQARVAHDLVGDALLNAARPGEPQEAHHRLGRALLSGVPGSDPLRALEHLLAAGHLPERTDIDAAAAAGLHGLVVDEALEAVVQMGERYLAAQGTSAETRNGLTARVNLAGALFGTGRRDRGAALLDDLEPRLQRLGDVLLDTDAFLARRLADMVNSDDALVAQALGLLSRLPAGEVARRCVLAAWTAHHLVNLNRPQDAADVLARAHREADLLPDDSLRATLLWLDYQVAACRTGAPTEARRAFERVRGFADLSDDSYVEFTALMCQADHTLRFGTIRDFGALRPRLDAIADVLPRPDIAWFAAAVATAFEIARGDLTAAQVAIERSTALGSGAAFDGAGGVLVQWVQLWWERGDLGLQRGALPADPTPELGAVVLCGFGLTCLQAGDRTGADAAARTLAALDEVVPVGYHRWGFVGSAAAEIADRTADATLGARLVDALEPHRGSGLAAAGIGYLGAAEGAIGRARAASGARDEAIRDLLAAFETDRDRGAGRWASRWATRAAELLQVGDDLQELALADRLLSEAARLAEPSA